jgi:DNA-binding NarL/FixJ family response regulator
MAIRAGVQQRERLLREGLGQLLQAEDDIEVVGAVATGDDLVGLCEQERPDLALVDLDSPDWSAGRMATRLKRAFPRLRLVGLYAGLNPAGTRLVRQTGTVAVSHRDGIGPILAAVRGDSPGFTSPVRQIGAHARHHLPGISLTPREVAVLTLVGGGHTSREISDQLRISHKTVENHKQRIFGKLGVQNQAHAVSIAMRKGMISPEQAIGVAVGE